MARPRHSEIGFTLVELLTVVAIVGVLMTVAVVTVNSDEYSRGVEGFADKVAIRCETAKQRAVARSRWQRVEVSEQEIVHWEGCAAAQPGVPCPPTGMADPDHFEVVATVVPPSADIYVHALATRTHASPDDGVPAEGTNLGSVIDFAPDGTAQPGTIFIGREGGSEAFRVGVYRATGSVSVWEDW